MLNAVSSILKTWMIISAFYYCVLYHQGSQGKNADRISVLNKIEDKYDWTGINFPASYEDIATFEELKSAIIF